jgi:hypothetical protein
MSGRSLESMFRWHQRSVDRAVESTGQHIGEYLYSEHLKHDRIKYMVLKLVSVCTKPLDGIVTTIIPSSDRFYLLVFHVLNLGQTKDE